MKSSKDHSDNKQLDQSGQISSQEDTIKKLSLEVSKLSYEDCLEQLDFILSKLQNETLLVEDLQLNYLKAKLYLDHCVSLHGHNHTLYEGFLLLLIHFHKFSNRVRWHA